MTPGDDIGGEHAGREDGGFEDGRFEDDTGTCAPAPGDPPRARRAGAGSVRTVAAGTAVVAVACVVAIAATGAFGGDGGGPDATAPTAPPKTAKVERTTLTRTETVDGNLGYGPATAVRAPSGPPVSGGDAQNEGAPAAGGGVVTWLPEAGDVIERGAAVYTIDEAKVPLLYGSTPFYRALDVGAEGKDVEVLEANLAALGHSGFTADDTYTDGTASAVVSWQEDLGREQTGTVGPGEAVVAGGARRIADVQAVRGSAPEGDVLTWTGTERIVTVALEVQYEDLVDEGTGADVELPDGTVVNAEVTEVGTAATAEPSDGGGGDPASGAEEEATLPVTLAVGKQKKLGRYEAAPVDVTVTAETREDVLAVPINALVALREGGYALETVGAKGIAYTPVELGIFAGGMVEVAGDGVTAGMVVGVPK
ncbi:peptidoglycan-binding domain-containing protein [Streptomyces sp. WMMC500]|uniref:peptidoglycan-binding domain-containing protein n=1 Tax=Streptomyces sp. WMMC500 TaxID=3015154 RepID=UPI00248B381F|nr:peptidoglycan-binding domain-containing protein [Streptomyces sp. WMMC500]WBB62544.1 peptidoglycan-binding domain-containing protein [Streptomyces sp. WMMC500]